MKASEKYWHETAFVSGLSIDHKEVYDQLVSLEAVIKFAKAFSYYTQDGAHIVLKDVIKARTKEYNQLIKTHQLDQ